jgi:hypothetical protein
MGKEVKRTAWAWCRLHLRNVWTYACDVIYFLPYNLHLELMGLASST